MTPRETEEYAANAVVKAYPDWFAGWTRTQDAYAHHDFRLSLPLGGTLKLEVKGRQSTDYFDEARWTIGVPKLQADIDLLAYVWPFDPPRVFIVNLRSKRKQHGDLVEYLDETPSRQGRPRKEDENRGIPADWFTEVLPVEEDYPRSAWDTDY